MAANRLKPLYDLHSWTGLVTGLILYIVLFSGSVSLFVDEIWPFALGPDHTRADAAINTALVDQAFGRARIEAQDTPKLSGYILLPGPDRSFLHMSLSTGEAEIQLLGDGATRSLVPRSRPALPLVLEALHTDLLLPAPWGRYFVALTGLVFVVMVLSGLWLHRKIVRELFTLRLRRSARLKWTDLHKSIGAFLLPFAVMIGWTGAILGLSQPLLTGANLISYDFDGDRAAAAFAGPLAGAPQQPVPTPTPQPLSAMLDNARRAVPGFVPIQANFNFRDGRIDRVRLFGDSGNRLTYFPMIVMNAETGKVAATEDWRNRGGARAAYAMITPLHYASFGGLGMKILYALAGLGTCFSVASGLMIWLTRARLHGPSRRHRTMERLGLGIMAGFPLTIAALFPLSIILPGLDGSSTTPLSLTVLGLACGLGAAPFAFPKLSVRAYLGATTLVCTATTLWWIWST